METFYVPIYIKPNVYNEEKVCIGLVYLNQGHLYFAYSDKKIQWAIQFTTARSQGTIKRYLKRVHQEIKNVNEDHSLLRQLQEPLQSDFYQKLSRNKVDVIQWGSPIAIESPMESWKFEKLAMKVVGDLSKNNVSRKSGKIGFRKRVNQIMSKKSFSIFEKNSIFYPDELEGIFTPHKIDLILLETTVLGIQFIDFSVSVPTIEKNIVQFSRLVRSLQLYAEKHGIPVKGFYVAYQTPRAQKQKALLDRIIRDESKRFELVPMSKVQDVLKK